MRQFLRLVFFAVLLAMAVFAITMAIYHETPQQTLGRITEQYDNFVGIQPPPPIPVARPVLPPTSPPPTLTIAPPAPAHVVAPMPAAPVPAPATAPITTTPQDPIAWLIAHKNRWPKQVTLLETTKVPVTYQGRPAGFTWIPGGNSVEVVSIEGGNVNLLVGESPVAVPIQATDLSSFAQVEMEKPEPAAVTEIPATNVVAVNNVAPPSATAPAPTNALPQTNATPADRAFGTVGAPPAPRLPAKVLPAGEKSPLITSFTPTVHEIRNATSGLLHPGILQTKEQLNTMQRHVRNGEQPWASAFEAFSQVPACRTDPRILYAGWTDIPRGGGLGKGGNFVTFRMAKDANTAYKQVVMWYITGDETYRLNALKIIRDYCAIKTVAPHWDAQIRWGVASYQLCCAAEVLRYSDGNSEASRWTDDDTAQFSALMKAGEGLVAGTGYWMNQHGFSTMGEMGTAIFLDDKALYDEAVERTTVNSQGQQGGRNGSIEWQMRLVTENFETHEPVKPQVQVVEMIRDQAHAWINVAALSTCCQTIYNQGTKVDPVTGTVSTAADAVDAFDFLDNRLLAGTDYITRFTLGQPVTWIPIDMGDQIKGEPRSFYDLGILYNHYRYIENWPTSDPRLQAVAEAYESLIPEPDAIDFPCASTLLLTPDNALAPPGAAPGSEAKANR